MARARNLKPGFFRNADLAEFGPWERLLFAGLWTLADREGRLEDKPKQIKMDLFPADDVNVDAMLDTLATGAPHMLRRYTVNGVRYLQVVNFRKHQNPHRDEKPSTIPGPDGSMPEQAKPKASTVPAPCKPGASPVPIGLTPESLSLNPDSLNTQTEPPPASTVPAAPGVEGVAMRVCWEMEKQGISGVRALDPELVAMVNRGADVAVFAGAAQTAVTKNNPAFNYVLGIVRRRMEQAAHVAAIPLAVPKAPAVTVPGRAGPDPLLAVLDERDRNAARPPPGFFEQVGKALRFKGLSPEPDGAAGAA